MKLRTKRRKQHVEAHNKADAAVFQSEKQLKEFGDKLSADSKAKIEAAIGRVKEALKGDNVSEMESSVEALNQIWQQASTEMYQNVNQQQAQPGPEASQQKTGTDDQTVDAEFEEMK